MLEYTAKAGTSAFMFPPYPITQKVNSCAEAVKNNNC